MRIEMRVVELTTAFWALDVTNEEYEQLREERTHLEELLPRAQKVEDDPNPPRLVHIEWEAVQD